MFSLLVAKLYISKGKYNNLFKNTYISLSLCLDCYIHIIYAHVCICMCMYVYVYVYMCMCMYVFIYLYSFCINYTGHQCKTVTLLIDLSCINKFIYLFIYLLRT